MLQGLDFVLFNCNIIDKALSLVQGIIPFVRGGDNPCRVVHEVFIQLHKVMSFYRHRMGRKSYPDGIRLGVIGAAYQIAIAEKYPAPVTQDKAQVPGIARIRVIVLRLRQSL